MSELKHVSLSEVQNKIENLLKCTDKYVMHVFHEDTYSIYDTNKDTVCMATKLVNPKSETKYNVSIDNAVTPHIYVMQNCDFGDNRYCKRIYDLMEHEYTIGGGLPITHKKQFLRSQIKHFSDVEDKQKQRNKLKSVVATLMSYRCPMSVIKRDFYVFNDAHKKANMDFIDTNHSAGTFYIYHTINGKLIAYVDDNSTYMLSPMPASAKSLVEKLQQKAIQQQR
ncbi:MAG: hypothetical protein MJ158_03150 [Alphaproteobacteria bacterium]|nr:hypothetical protein [Alphaproteobacteria bacterium]